MITRFFQRLESSCNPYPLAVFRISVYLGLIVHFFPSFIAFEENYGVGAHRVDNWSYSFFELLSKLSPDLVVGLAALTCGACIAGLLGLWPRLSALFTFAGLYVFASFNSLNIQSLAISEAWGVLLLFCFFPENSNALSLPGLFGRKIQKISRYPRDLLLIYFMIGFFFAGVEKIIAGWPLNNEMHLLLNYPKGFMLRDWVVDQAWLKTASVGMVSSSATVILELGIPFLLLFRKTRLAALIMYELFFVLIISMMEVPPLFFFLFAGAGMLAIDDERMGTWLGGGSPRKSPNPAALTVLTLAVFFLAGCTVDPASPNPGTWSKIKIALIKMSPRLGIETYQTCPSPMTATTAATLATKRMAPGATTTQVAAQGTTIPVFSIAVTEQVRLASSYLMGRTSELEPYSGFLLHVLDRNFGLPWAKPFLTDLTNKARQHHSYTPLYARLFNASATLSEPPPAQMLDVWALHCKQYPLPDTFGTMLSDATSKGDLRIMQSVLALEWAIEQGCIAPSKHPESIRLAQRKRLEEVAAERYETADSFAIDAMALLYATGNGVRVRPEWIAALRNAQKPDGGWGANRTAEKTSDKTTVMAFWVLLEQQSAGHNKRFRWLP